MPRGRMQKSPCGASRSRRRPERCMRTFCRYSSAVPLSSLISFILWIINDSPGHCPQLCVQDTACTMCRSPRRAPRPDRSVVLDLKEAAASEPHFYVNRTYEWRLHASRMSLSAEQCREAVLTVKEAPRRHRGARCCRANFTGGRNSCRCVSP